MTQLITLESKVTKSSTLSYDSFCKKWVEFLQVKPASVKAYVKGVKNFFAFLQKKNISEITRAVLLSYREYLKPLTPEAVEKEKRSGIRIDNAHFQAATSNLYLTATKLFIDYLYQEGLLQSNCAERIKIFKTDMVHSKAALSENNTKKIIGKLNLACATAGNKASTLKSKRDRAIYVLMTCCGLRCVEVMRANKGDLILNIDKYFLHVQGKGRNDKKDCVEVPIGVLKVINDYLAERGKVSDDEPLFASVSHRNFGGRLTTVSISRIIKGIFRANDIDTPSFTAHSLRHTCATTMILHGVPLRKVQEVLRHKSVVVTERYLRDNDRYNNGGESVAAAAFGL
ncbi:MAG: tyrosine-type recombinase/integrase [Selenomonadaceae bacterium]|nr:tyrosine-type recombinase/integrase [Selenomonadaceae bacterium]